MIQHRDGHRGPAEPAAPEPDLRRALRALDPGADDPTYWFRFRSRVMGLVERELARRSMLADLTVPDLVVLWGRTLVPTALLAAGLAAFLLMQGVPAPAITPFGVEEELAEGLDGAPIPTVLSSEDQLDAGGVIFASEAY